MSQEHKPFVHLHVHSEFSLLDGLSRLDHLTARANELNMPALALTDHGTMYGTIEFFKACQEAGIKPILGVETYVAKRRMTDKDPELDRDRYHLLLLAQNHTGYLNLLKLVSAAQLDGFYYRPRVDHQLLERYSEGLIATTGCLAGEIPKAIQFGQKAKARKLIEWYLDVFGRERFFIELQEHNIEDLTRVNKTLLEIAERYDLRTVATNDVHYTTAEEAEPHDVLLCIQTGKTVDMADRMRLSDASYYLKSYDEMYALFGEIPGALDNTLLIAEMCDVDPVPHGYHLPNFEVPEGYTAETFLRQLCEKGLESLYGRVRAESDEELRQRLNYELQIIHNVGFDAYFLIVWDLCEFARKRDIWWNVRGSGSGSVVAFTLGITNIDPLIDGLIFERFLNPDRVSMPDIDIDYPDDRRHEMIEYTIQKYGSDKVAQIITFGTMGARGAIRDVGRALDVPLSEVDNIAKLIPAVSGKPASIADALTPDHEFFSKDLRDLYDQDEGVRNLVDTAQSLEGVSRHASTHAAGVIISDKDLVEYTPLHRPTSGGDNEEGIGVVTQWPMEVLDYIGLLKVDFLGLSTLTVMRAATDLIEERHGIRYTMDNIPYRLEHVGPDPTKSTQALYDLLGRGDVAGIFQVESAGMRRLMSDMKPKRFEHIMAAISLYRPGPMENIPEYVSRMHGRAPITYHHADLEPILAETYGILVYQEQIIKIASEFAGYTPGEADLIRKAVAKKKKDELENHKTRFFDGAIERGYSYPECENIWKDIEFFARYGFNKAHAADYAVITCQTAFLKAHYPVEYMTALLSVEKNDTVKVAQYLVEARRMGIAVAPPNMNCSQLDFSIEGDSNSPVIRYGLGAIKNAGAAAMELMLDERRENGCFHGLADLSERVDLRRVGKRALESMMKVGVFDEWGSRPQLLESLDRLIAHSGSTIDAAAAGQMSLFGGLSGAANNIGVEILRTELSMPEPDHRELLAWEKDLVGVYLSEHPLEQYQDLVLELQTTTTGELAEIATDQPVSILGLLSGLRAFKTRKGHDMATGTLEDLQGSVDLIFFPRTWQEVASKAVVDNVFLVRGRVRLEGGDHIRIVVSALENNLNLAREKTNLQAIPASSARTPAVPRHEDTESNYQPANAASAAVQSTRAPERESAQISGSNVPPPPPNFDEEYAVQAIVEKDQDSVEGEEEMDIPSHEEEAEEPADNLVQEESRRKITVEISARNDWRDICREVVNVAGRFQGSDSLQIRVSGHPLSMDFPNQNTNYTPELADSLMKLPAIVSVTTS